MKVWPQLFLIAGTNRNVGKTTLACRVIEQISKEQQVVGVKISPHFHELGSTLEIVHQSKNCFITFETSPVPVKDSSRMLAAGAQRVYYIQANDESLPEVFEFLHWNIPGSMAVVCESAALRRFVEPGMFVILSGKGEVVKNLDLLLWADVHVQDFNFQSLKFRFSHGGWQK